MEHRKMVLTKENAHNKWNTDISIDALHKATCSSRKAYHLKLKAALLENSGILNTLRKKELLILGKFCNTKLKQPYKKDVQCDT